MKRSQSMMNTGLRGGGLKALFSVTCETKIKNGVTKHYKVYRILFFKIKFNTVFLTNKVYKVDKNGKKRQVTNKKELFRYLNRVSGENNVITIPDTKMLSFHIDHLSGSNNIIDLPWVDDASSFACYNLYGSNNEIKIKSPVEKNPSSLASFQVSITGMGDNCKLYIDEVKSIHGAEFVFANNRKVVIGRDCLFAKGTKIWVTDGHPIYDIKTGKRINESKDVIIGNHVWVGRDVSINKGVVIPDGCVIGANSFVNKQFEEPNTIIAGIPAKVVKRDIYWERY